MKKGEIRQQTDHDRLMRFAKLVFAMRRTQIMLSTCNHGAAELLMPQVEEYEKSVDYMTDKILG